MLRFFGAITLSFFALTEVHAEPAHFCRNSFAPGEKIEPRFMGMSYAIIMHALAEKYCGAKPVAMGPKFLAYLESQGCGSKTEIYQDVAASISKVESASLKLMAAGGDSTLPISEEQAKSWAKDVSERLGGCERLIELHASKLDSWK